LPLQSARARLYHQVSVKDNNGTEEQGFGCYANVRRAHIPGGTTPGARLARPSDYSRLSEEASTLPAARGLEQQGERRKLTPITVVASIDPELLENLIDMEEIDADSVDDCTVESAMEYLESAQERSASVTAEYVKAEVLAKVTFAMSEKDPALRVVKAVADDCSLHRNRRLDFINGKPKKTCRASGVGDQVGHPQGSDREQTRDEQVGTVMRG
jgi:hypothetical protein